MICKGCVHFFLFLKGVPPIRNISNNCIICCVQHKNKTQPCYVECTGRRSNNYDVNLVITVELLLVFAAANS